MWEYTGKQRPPFAEEPAPGQESVWDYPRPPALVRYDGLVEVKHAGALSRAPATPYGYWKRRVRPPTTCRPKQLI